jgi:hypothetical protein
LKVRVKKEGHSLIPRVVAAGSAPVNIWFLWSSWEISSQQMGMRRLGCCMECGYGPQLGVASVLSYSIPTLQKISSYAGEGGFMVCPDVLLHLRIPVPTIFKFLANYSEK